MREKLGPERVPKTSHVDTSERYNTTIRYYVRYRYIAFSYLVGVIIHDYINVKYYNVHDKLHIRRLIIAGCTRNEMIMYRNASNNIILALKRFSFNYRGGYILRNDFGFRLPTV